MTLANHLKNPKNQREGSSQAGSFFQLVLDCAQSQEDSIMELELYSALQGIGVPEEKAKAVVESVNKAIDSRYAIHAKELATRGDVEQVRADLHIEVEKVRAEIAKVEANLVKWLVGTGLVIIGTIAALISRLPTI